MFLIGPRKGNPRRNKDATLRAVKATGTELGVITHERTMKEVEAGWITTPVPVSTAPPMVPITPRYAIPEQHGNYAEKVRLIDDFRASGVNSTVSVADTCVPDGLDSLLAMCTNYQRLLVGRRVLVCSVDFSHAYKNIPLPVSQEHFASIVSPNREGEPLVGRLRTQPLARQERPPTGLGLPRYSSS